jgi:hypothetical protein
MQIGKYTAQSRSQQLYWCINLTDETERVQTKQKKCEEKKTTRVAKVKTGLSIDK